ncbi:MAG: M23 family metallopeptidase [Verrucomicrobiota bacterium]
MSKHALRFILIFSMQMSCLFAADAEQIHLVLPTENDLLLEDDLNGYYQPTVSKRAISGRYGFVRTRGPEPPRFFEKFHEGIDVKPLRRDGNGVPLDPVMAIADGKVVYVNDRPSASNYGRYIVIRHPFGKYFMYSFSGHLGKVSTSTGAEVKAGDPIGILGYTGAGINKERAHLHLELTFKLRDSYDAWFQEPGVGYGGDRKNLHGDYNGLGYLGVDVAPLLLASREGTSPTVPELLNSLEPHFKVMIPAGEEYLYWQKQFPFQVEGGISQPLPKSWEMTVNRIGIPLRFKPSDRKVESPYVSWFKPYKKVQDYFTLGLVVKKGSKFLLTSHGGKWISQLTWDGKPEPKENPVKKHPKLK